MQQIVTNLSSTSIFMNMFIKRNININKFMGFIVCNYTILILTSSSRVNLY